MKTLKRNEGVERKNRGAGWIPGGGWHGGNMDKQLAETPRQGGQAEKISRLFATPIQREVGEEEKVLQEKRGSGAASFHENNRGVPRVLQSKMEAALNTDLSNVKVHAASSQATQIGALAYTQGDDIHFAPGQYSPKTSTGQRLLGHELAHVVQQREGRVKATGSVLGLPLNDSGVLENEADTIAGKMK